MDALLIGLVIGLLVGIPIGGLAYQWASESGQGESGYEATGDSTPVDSPNVALSRELLRRTT